MRLTIESCVTEYVNVQYICSGWSIKLVFSKKLCQKLIYFQQYKYKKYFSHLLRQEDLGGSSVQTGMCKYNALLISPFPQFYDQGVPLT